MVSPSLSLTVNANHHYDSGLLLAYLLTSEATRDSLKNVVEPQDGVDRKSIWHNFPAEEIYLKAFAPDTARLHWILFSDVTTQLTVAYAEVQIFT